MQPATKRIGVSKDESKWWDFLFRGVQRFGLGTHSVFGSHTLHVVVTAYAASTAAKAASILGLGASYPHPIQDGGVLRAQRVYRRTATARRHIRLLQLKVSFEVVRRF